MSWAAGYSLSRRPLPGNSCSAVELVMGVACKDSTVAAFGSVSLSYKLTCRRKDHLLSIGVRWSYLAIGALVDEELVP